MQGRGQYNIVLDDALTFFGICAGSKAVLNRSTFSVLSRCLCWPGGSLALSGAIKPCAHRLQANRTDAFAFLGASFRES